MGFLYVVAIALVAATVAAALITGQWLGQRRKAVFQLEMVAEELRRQVVELEESKEETAGHLRALRRLRQQKREILAELYDELHELMAEDTKAIGVSLGLRKAAFELEGAAA